MELYFLHKPEYDRLYNCSFYDIEIIPHETRSFRILGGLFMAMFAIFEAAYIPCLIVLYRFTEPCYRLMFLIGFMDVITLFVCGFFTGFFAWNGSIFCSSPTLIYFIGNFGTALWGLQADSSVFLAFNRCLAIWNPYWCNKLFCGKRVYLWLIPGTIHMFAFLIFTKPALFNAINFSWFFNPHLGYFVDPQPVYTNILHTVHNFTIAISFILIYLLFAIAFYRSTHKITPVNNEAGKRIDESNRSVFLQVLLICSCNAISSIEYTIMQFFQLPIWLIISGSLLWLLAHGLPPIIYLTMNKSIRRGVLRLCNKKLGRDTTISRMRRMSKYQTTNAFTITRIRNMSIMK